LGDCLQGRVIKLDRKFPLVELEDGRLMRCKHATDMVKNAGVRAVVGDNVLLNWAEGQDMPLIVSINPRTTSLIRKDPTERSLPQVLASNFDRVLVVHPLNQLNVARLQRELVLAHETGAKVGVVLTKADLAKDEEALVEARRTVESQVGQEVEVLVISNEDEEGLDEVRRLIEPGTCTVLIGRSGVGKSSMVNLLAGSDVARTGAVREYDGKGRHTTVSREIIRLPNGGCVVDMPGVRGLGMWEAEQGIGVAFSEIEELAAHCRFADCRHISEPGCAVRAAVECGELAKERLEAYCKLLDETAQVRRRKEQAAWKHGKMSGVRTFKQKHNHTSK